MSAVVANITADVAIPAAPVVPPGMVASLPDPGGYDPPQRLIYSLLGDLTSSSIVSEGSTAGALRFDAATATISTVIRASMAIVIMIAVFFIKYRIINSGYDINRKAFDAPIKNGPSDYSICFINML